MLKIMIYQQSYNETLPIRKIIYGVIRAMKLQCVVDTYLNDKNVLDRLSDNPYEYDIVILDTLVKQSASICRFLRNSNQYSALALLCKSIEQVSDYIRYRPSILIYDILDQKQIAKQIYLICLEMHRHNRYFVAKTREEIIRIPYENIDFFESNGRLVYLYTVKGNQKYEFTAKLDDIQTRVAEDVFLRCHQSYLVNCMNILRIDRSFKKCIMVSGNEVDISRRSYSAFITEYEKKHQINRRAR